MSRAFVKEDDTEQAVPSLRVPSRATNYVTPRGLQLLRDQIKRLSDLREEHQAQDDLASKSVVLEAERDLSYYVERLRTAVLVEPQPNPSGQVRFGSFVSAVDEEGSVYDVRLVGEDEADVPQGLVSYVSPLAKALMGARVGDDVLWQRPAGVIRLEILTVDGVSV